MLALKNDTGSDSRAVTIRGAQDRHPEDSSGSSETGQSLEEEGRTIDDKIMIDGIDISWLSLAALRSSLAIIPQEPVLFSGTIRYNVDPFSVASDASVWQAL